MNLFTFKCPRKDNPELFDDTKEKREKRELFDQSELNPLPKPRLTKNMWEAGG